MRYLGLVVSILALFSFSSCNKDSGNSAVDSNGACTQATISAYNRLANRSVSAYSTRSELQSIKSDCANYKALIGNKSCKAEKLSTGETTTIYSSSVDSVCNMADYMLNNQGSSSSSGNSSASTSTACSSSVISAYNDVSADTILLSEFSSLPYLEKAVESCNRFELLVGSKSCEASKNGSNIWISSWSHQTVCTRAKSLKQTALKEAEKQAAIDKTQLLGSKEMITFFTLKAVSAKGEDIIVFQQGKAFLADEKNVIDESQPYCLVSAKFSTFMKGVGRFEFKNVFVPQNENLLALALVSENVNEENSINCLNGLGKQAQKLTVGDLKTISKTTVLLN